MTASAATTLQLEVDQEAIWPLEAFLGAEYAQADRKHTAQLCEATVTVSP